MLHRPPKGGTPSLGRTRPLLVLAARVLVLVLGRASAPARSRGAVKPRFLNTDIKQRSPHAHDANRSAERVRRSYAGRLTAGSRLGSIRPLVPGAGYAGIGRSALVRALQLRLAESGDTPGPIDGHSGPLTMQAVERFQVADRLQADGIAGVVTWHALRAAGPDASGARPPQKRPATHGRPVPKLQPVPEAAQQHRLVPALPVKLVLLGLAALGLATMSFSYGRTRDRAGRARANAGPRGLRVKPVPLPPGWRAPTGSLIAEHEERER